jgi:hypothetical protein
MKRRKDTISYFLINVDTEACSALLSLAQGNTMHVALQSEAVNSAKHFTSTSCGRGYTQIKESTEGYSR